MAIPADNPKIVYNAVTLWLPRKFTKWDLTRTDTPTITKGYTYTQRASYPVISEVKATTPMFFGNATSGLYYEDWDGTGAGDFITAWDLFMAWARPGKVFSLYKHADGGAGARNYFQYCVWVAKNDGLKHLVGLDRQTLTISARTETAAR